MNTLWKFCALVQPIMLFFVVISYIGAKQINADLKQSIANANANANLECFSQGVELKPENGTLAAMIYFACINRELKNDRRD